MVVSSQARNPKLKIDRQKEHDFSHDKDRCTKCGMRLSVWEDTHVFCAGKPYSINNKRSLAKTSEPFVRRGAVV
jgi:hypothetical protein